MDVSVYDGQGNRYTLAEELGRGGQGTVFRVNRSAGRGLAVKVVLDPSTGGILRDGKSYKKYLRTIHRIWALPDLPNVAAPLAPLQEPCCGYIMRLMEGMEPVESLLKPRNTRDLGASLCAGGGLRKRLTVLRNLAEVLERLHSRGILYGDLSPGNVFVSRKSAEAEVWLIDADNLAWENDAGKAIGTPCYRAPEIMGGTRNSIRSDCYSFALLAYECLTFSKPFDGTLLDEETEEEDFGDTVYDRIERGEVPYVREPGTVNKARCGFSRRLEQVMTPELEELFLQTFGEQGRKRPETRPGMGRWLRAFEGACCQVLLCERGHAYLGRECPWCTEEERLASRALRWRLLASRTVRMYLSPESEDEDSGTVELETAREKIYEMRWSWEAAPGARRALTVSVPIKALGRAGRNYAPDTPAFEIQCLKSGCRIEKIFDARMKVRVTENGSPEGLRFTVEFLGTEVEFEVVKDE